MRYCLVMTNEGWPGEWLRGVLPLCILAVIAEEDMHGYAITQRLSTAGLGTVKGGTLYPILNRLEREGLVSSTWGAGVGGPGRKTFQITSQGLSQLAEKQEAWQTFTQRTAEVLTTSGGRV